MQLFLYAFFMVIGIFAGEPLWVIAAGLLDVADAIRDIKKRGC